MPIDARKLLRFSIPSVRQEITPRDAAFHALSIGIGRDPLDRAQLPFVDPLAGPVPVPAMALVLAHPGFCLAHPDSGVDPVAVLHGAQEFEISASVPVDGVVESRTRSTHLVDKGPGKPALLFTDTNLTDGDGKRFAMLRRTTFIRDGGGFGGDSSAPERPAPPQPQGDPDLVVDLPTRPEQALLYRLNGDLNPLHSDRDVAAKAGFPRPILHGLCSIGVIVHALLREFLDYRPDRLKALGLRFSAPVMPGETIRTEIWKNGAIRARVVERDVLIADQGWYRATSYRSL